jgi:hypothetical protein
MHRGYPPAVSILSSSLESRFLIEADRRERLTGLGSERLFRFWCVDVGESYFHLSLRHQDGQSVAVLDRHHAA